MYLEKIRSVVQHFKTSQKKKKLTIVTYVILSINYTPACWYITLICLWGMNWILIHNVDQFRSSKDLDNSQAVNRRILTAENCVRPQALLRGNVGDKVIGQVSLQVLVFPIININTPSAIHLHLNNTLIRKTSVWKDCKRSKKPWPFRNRRSMALKVRSYFRRVRKIAKRDY